MPLTPIALKEYQALLTQSGTSSPTATIIKNTYGGTPTLTRFLEGEYRITLEGAFPKPKTNFQITNNGGLTINYAIIWINNDQIAILTGDSGTPLDAQLSDTPVYITTKNN